MPVGKGDVPAALPLMPTELDVIVRLPCPPKAPVDDRPSLSAAFHAHRLPARPKTRALGSQLPELNTPLYGWTFCTANEGDSAVRAGGIVDAARIAGSALAHCPDKREAARAKAIELLGGTAASQSGRLAGNLSAGQFQRVLFAAPYFRIRRSSCSTSPSPSSTSAPPTVRSRSS